MRKNLDYFVLAIFMFFESLLWTITDLVRASRMRHTKRMHKRYNPPPAEDTDQPEAIINNGQDNQ